MLYYGKKELRVFFMRIGYTCIDRNEQHADLQIAVLRQFYVEKHFEDKRHEKNGERPRLQALLEFIRPGDIVYAESITRVCDSSEEFLAFIDQLINKNAGLVCVKEDLNSTTPEGKHLFLIFQTLLRLNRQTEIIKEKPQNCPASATSGIKHYGRPKIEMTETFVTAYQRWKAGETTAVEAMQMCGLKKNTFYNRVRELEQSVMSKKSY
jgi:DNA invertase Pin-like site-specific DNA recombinase